MDDLQPQETKPISDDQELAKALAGVSPDSNDTNTDDENPTIIPDEQPADGPTPEETESSVVGYNPPTTKDESAMPTTDNNDLTSVEKDALNELRPLVDKLDLSAEEKFDTYLLLIRSTDDKALIEPAHAAAKNIADEAKRAQALLDIIKEIDYLSNPPQPIV